MIVFNIASPRVAGEVRPAYRPDIDGLRAVAIISVVLYHADASLLPGGFIGVDVFFVISGFLISSLIFKELQQGHFSFYDFYIRRIRRIFPALVLMMSALWIASIFLLTGPEFAMLGKQILAGGGFISNLLQWRTAGYFDTDDNLKPLLHLWSLGIEEQFYIVWPVIVMMLWRRRFFAIILCVLLISFADNIWRTPSNAVEAFYLPFGRAWELLLGGLLAWRERFPSADAVGGKIGTMPMRQWQSLLGRSVALKNLAAALAVALLATGFIAVHPDSKFPGWWVSLPVFAAFLFIWAGEKAWINRKILAHPAMVFVGLISYPLYIWHWPLLSMLRIVKGAPPSPSATCAAVATAVLLAILTWWLVERPLRCSRHARGKIAAILSIAMVIISALGALSYARVIKTPQMAKEDAAVAEAVRHLAPRFNCLGIMDRNAPGFDSCRVWGNPQLKKTFIIWGDSFAGSWQPGVAALAKENGAKLVQFMYYSCPPLAGVRRTTRDPWVTPCDNFAFADSVIQTISQLHPSLIVLVGRWGHYLTGQYITTAPTGDATAETSRLAFKQKFPDTLRRLAGIGKVLVIKAVPTLHTSTETGLARDPNGFEPTLAEYRAFEAVPDDAIDRAARDIPGVKVLDPTGLLCDQKKCHAILHGIRLYMVGDTSHLKDENSIIFLPELKALTK